MIKDIQVGSRICYSSASGEKSFGKINRVKGSQYRIVWFRDSNFKQEDYIGKYGEATIVGWLNNNYISIIG